MRAAVDSSIVLDILLDDPLYGEVSQRLLEEYLNRGAVVICPVAYAESSACLSSPSKFREICKEIGLIYDSFDEGTCVLAAQMWRDYRRGGGPKQRILADFLIGAHAQNRADVLLARDRGFFRAYFKGLNVIEPKRTRG